ncbi:TadE family type IV pilus minor pilin [Nocardioides caeni]|uniref:TadE family type IV pilus minor pilin n=1 Tax=Nocardioides caeni TaxID=574700 RepID=UPI001EE7D263|nr:TadE family type IV pilus minor pilin [Nocardioides caeni]
MTAELAVGLPILLAVTAALTWLVAVAVGQVRAVDAARETARALARGEDPAAAIALGEAVAPDGVAITTAVSGQRIVVRASGRMEGPGGFLGSLPGARLEAEAVAVPEPTGAGP